MTYSKEVRSRRVPRDDEGPVRVGSRTVCPEILDGTGGRSSKTSPRGASSGGYSWNW